MKKIGVLVLWILSYGTETYAQLFDFPPTRETVEYSLPILSVEDSTFLNAQDFLMREHKLFFSRGLVENPYKEYNYCAVEIRTIEDGSDYYVVLNRYPGRKQKSTVGCFNHNGLTYIITGDAPKGMFSKTAKMRHFRYRDYVHYYFYSLEDDDGIRWSYQIRNGLLYPKFPIVFQDPVITPERREQILNTVLTSRNANSQSTDLQTGLRKIKIQIGKNQN